MKPIADRAFEESWKDETYWRCQEILAARKRTFLTGKVLDVACGTGDFLRFCPGGVGIDLHPLAIEACRAKGLDARQMEAEKLEFPDGSFDGVHCVSGLDHFNDAFQATREMWRVLKPGGVLYLTVNDITRRKFRFWDDYTHRRPFTRRSLVELLEDVGFVIERLGWVVLPPPYLGWTSRWPRLFLPLCRVWSRLKRRQMEVVARRPSGPASDGTPAR